MARDCRLESGCHPFGIVIVDPSANFTFLNPDALAAVAKWFQESCPLQVLDSERLPGSYWTLDIPSTLVVPARVVGSKLVAERYSEQHAEWRSAAFQSTLWATGPLFDIFAEGDHALASALRIFNLFGEQRIALSKDLGLAHQQFLHTHIDKLGARSTDPAKHNSPAASGSL